MKPRFFTRLVLFCLCPGKGESLVVLREYSLRRFPHVLRVTVLALGFLGQGASALFASATGERIIQQLEGGKIPSNKIEQFAGKLCQIGDGEDLSWLLRKLTSKEESLLTPFRAPLLEKLLAAEKTPQSDLASVGNLIASSENELNVMGLKLAKKWKIKELRGVLLEIAASKNSNEVQRTLSLEALVEFDPAAVAETVQKLVSSQDASERSEGFALLVRVDLAKAAEFAAESLAAGKSQEASEQVLLLAKRVGGKDALQLAASSREIPKETAEYVLQAALAEGVNLDALEAKLRTSAGNAPPLQLETVQAQQEFLAEVARVGDARQGEQLFHLEKLNCQKCHALGGVGGKVGPDLAAVGGSSPPDYLLRALLHPSADIKESYRTLKLITTDGELVQGILVSEGDDAVVLKDADGVERRVPREQIEEQNAGESLMPTGLPQLLNRSEFAHLIRFLTELGKPGMYAAPPTGIVRKYQYTELNAKLQVALDEQPLNAVQLITNAPAETWSTLYTDYSGWFDQAALDRCFKSAPKLLVRCELELSETVVRLIQFESEGKAAAAFLDGQPVRFGEPLSLAAGQRELLFAVESNAIKPFKLSLQLP